MGRATILLVLGCLAGCTSGRTLVVHEPQGALTVAAVVVTPVRLLGVDAPGWRRFELAQRQVDLGLRQLGERLAFVGPGELQVSRWEEPGWLGTTALPLLVREGVPAEQALLLRTTAERRDGASSDERHNVAGRARGGTAALHLSWHLTVELLHPSTRQVLAEVGGAVTVDPFADPTGEEEFDPAPPMTRLLEALTRDALGVAARWALPRTVEESGLTLALSPAVTAAQPDAAEAQPDALQAELWMYARARFLAPWLPEAEATALARTPSGLLVVGAPASAPVQPGDLILSVDGAPALPQVLARRRLAGAPVPVRVGRAGAERETAIP